MPLAEWSFRYLGPSSDRRTNRWQITPACGHSPFEPQTTMFAEQFVACPKCGATAWAQYNNQTIRAFTYDD